jgi:hypothetical protein
MHVFIHVRCCLKSSHLEKLPTERAASDPDQLVLDSALVQVERIRILQLLQSGTRGSSLHSAWRVVTHTLSV